MRDGSVHYSVIMKVSSPEKLVSVVRKLYLMDVIEVIPVRASETPCKEREDTLGH